MFTDNRDAELSVLRRWGQLLRTARWGAVVIADDGTFELINPAFAAMHGMSEDALVGRPCSSVMTESAALALPARLRACREQGHIRFEAEHVRADGTAFPVAVDMSALPDGETGQRHACLIEDISERRRGEEELRHSRRWLRDLFELAPDAVVVIDEDGTIVLANEEAAALFGHPARALRGRPVESLIPPRFRDRHPAHRSAFARQGVRRPMGRGLELWALRNGGEEFPVEISLSPIDDGTHRRVAAVVRDVSERRRFERDLRRLADHDPLTGLVNRRRFAEQLDHQLDLARRYGADGALLLIDLDNFKYVNDTLGHSAGDEVIRAAGRLLASAARHSDVVGRLGGDEFVVLLPRGGVREATALAELLIARIERHPFVVDGSETVRVTASIGAQVLDDEAIALTAEELLARADMAMYDAKEAGRSRTSLYTTATPLRSRMAERLGMSQRLRTALDRDGLVLYAQPIMPVASTSDRRRYELLLRLRDQSATVHLPDTFLATAEQFGLMQRVDHWVVAEALQLAAAASDDVELAVNLSAQAFTDGELVDLIAREAERTGADLQRIVFEITESAAFSNLDVAYELTSRLRALGCRLALDDFGTGFGSFLYVKHLPFDILKIDGSFVRRVCDDPADQVIVQAMVQAAHALGKVAIAEWVTDEATLERLADYKVDFAQGFLLGHPRPAWQAVPTRAG